MSLMNFAELLSRQTLFANAQTQELQLLAKIAKKLTLKKGHALVTQGGKTEAMYVILTGRAAVISKDHEGREIILDQVGPDEYIGELHVIDGAPHSADVVALTDMDVLCLERKVLTACMISNPQLSLAMLSGLAQRLRHSDQRVRSLAHQNVVERMLQTLRKFPGQKLSTTYLAKTVGCSRETAARVLTDLQMQGRLELAQGSWQVIDSSV
jgi:CRP/FNR family transcriptional regulator, cyclic AMP receptor protein